MMNIDTNSDTMAKPSRKLPMMSMPWSKSACCSAVSVALSTISAPDAGRISLMAVATVAGSTP